MAPQGPRKASAIACALFLLRFSGFIGCGCQIYVSKARWCRRHTGGIVTNVITFRILKCYFQRHNNYLGGVFPQRRLSRCVVRPASVRVKLEFFLGFLEVLRNKHASCGRLNLSSEFS
ncbi:hypothetical protein BX600DRAFT_255246 [Xylariales sp. PMI_506]|nr:hypothetical protein BX600DRAFT_255246 [Xylariales sp. PMI_506]